MEDEKTRKLILRARRAPEDVEKAVEAREHARKGTRKRKKRIPRNGYSPFRKRGAGEKQARANGNGDDQSHRRRSGFGFIDEWGERYLREHGSVKVRTAMAVRDAARASERKGQDPFADAFYVGKTIAKGWALSPKNLNRGLETLEKIGSIKTMERERGRHARIVLLAGIDGEDMATPTDRPEQPPD